ncbi:MAG: nuclear transport factor 2 family protein [Bacteroidota bacterium]
MKKLIPVLLLAACNASVKVEYDDPKADDIHKILDDWHKAAADADFEKYFSYFENDSSIFMGTDATERWTIAEFKPWSKPYFDRGKAWSFKVTERVVYFSKDGKTSWFDEALDTPNLGPSRGTGVLIRTSDGWKIAHYNLTVPIPNELVGNVVEQIDSVLNK